MSLVMLIALVVIFAVILAARRHRARVTVIETRPDPKDDSDA